VDWIFIPFMCIGAIHVSLFGISLKN